MNTLMNWINEPGLIRWIVDLVVLPVLVVGVVYGLKAILVRVGPTPEADQIGPDFWRRSLTLLAPVASLIGVASLWQFRFADLANRASLDPGRQLVLVEWTAGIAMALLATIVLALLIKAINRGLYAIVHWLDSKGRQTGGVKVQDTVLVTPYRVRKFLIFALRIVRFALVLVLLYAYVPLVLGYIPATSAFADRIAPMVVAPLQKIGLAILGYIPRLISLILILIGVRFFLRTLGFVMEAVGAGHITIPGFDPEWADQTLRLLRIVVVFGTLMLIYPFLPGAGSELFKGFSLFVGALFTLGASSSVANVISGVILTYTRSFSLGDRVQIGETTGDVIQQGLFVTRMRTIFNEEVTVPNTVALGGRVVNYSAAAQRPEGLGLRVTAGIGYDVDWRQVHELMKGAAADTENIVDDPEPFVIQSSLNDFAVEYILVASTREPKKALRTQSELRQHVLDRFNAAGVEIMTPDVAALRNSVEPAIPREQVPDATPSMFRFLGVPQPGV
jgi:small-conductance mechanosensitive channel